MKPGLPTQPGSSSASFICCQRCPPPRLTWLLEGPATEGSRCHAPSTGLCFPIPECAPSHAAEPTVKGTGMGTPFSAHAKHESCWGEIWGASWRRGGWLFGKACARGLHSAGSAELASLAPLPRISYLTFRSTVLTGPRSGSPLGLGRWRKFEQLQNLPGGYLQLHTCFFFFFFKPTS